MAIVRAVKSGNWSDPTVWNTGALPTSADDVYSNTFVVACNYTTTVLSIRNQVATGVTAGGSFTAVNGVTLTLNGSGVLGTSTTVLFSDLTAGQSFAIAGNVTGIQNTSNSTTINNRASGTLNITGTVTGGSGTNISYSVGITNNTSGILNITGSVVGGSGTSGNCHAIINYGSCYSTGSINGGTTSNSCGIFSSGYISAVGPLTGGSGTNTAGAHGIYCSGTATGQIQATVNGGTGTGGNNAGLYNLGSITVTGDITAGSSSNYGVNNGASGVIQINGNVAGGVGSSVSNASGMLNTGVAIIAGNVTGGSGSSGNCFGVNNSGSLQITAGAGGPSSVRSGSQSTAYGISNSGTGTLLLDATVYGGSTSVAHGIYNTSTAPLAIIVNMNIYGGSFAGSHGIYNDSASGAILTGSVSCGVYGGSATNCVGISNNSTGEVNVSSLVGIVGGSAAGAYGVQNSGAGRVRGSRIMGGSNATAYGVVNNGTGILICNGAFSSSSAPAIGPGSNQQVTLISGPLESDTTGVNPCVALRAFFDNTNTNSISLRLPSSNQDGSTSGTITLYPPTAYTSSYPSTADVRKGITFGAGGALVGTCYVPAAASVAIGVPIDNTIGTAAITAATIRSALGLASNNLDAQLNAIPKTAAPTVQEIRAEMDSNSTKLVNLDATVSSRSTYNGADTIGTTVLLERLTASRGAKLDLLDASVSSRLASTNYTAPPAATVVATAVWNSADKAGYSLTESERQAISTAVQQGILNENDGQQILNAIVGAIGNQNIDQIALVAAIRADLERSGGTLATRLAAANYITPPSVEAIATAAWTRESRTITGGSVDSAPQPSIPTAEQNAAATRAELALELSRLDVSIGSRPSATDNAAAVWAYASRTLSSVLAIVSGVWNASGRTITGGTVDTLVNAPNVPTQEEIAAEVWSAPERTITGGTLDSAPIDVGDVAEAVREELSPELARISNAATTQEVAEIFEVAIE